MTLKEPGLGREKRNADCGYSESEFPSYPHYPHDDFCINVVRSSPPRVGVGVPILPILPTGRQGLSPLQGYLAHKKQPPPLDHHRALDVVLL